MNYVDTPHFYNFMKIVFYYNSFCFRLEYGEDNTKEASRTYIAARLFPIFTVIIWDTLAAFFRSRIRGTILRLCPQGKLSAIGGKFKRNIITLGRYFFLLIFQYYPIHSMALLFDGKVGGDL